MSIDIQGFLHKKYYICDMNYIMSIPDQVISVVSKNEKPTDGNLLLSLRDSIYLAKNIKCSVELNHELGSFLIDKNGEYEMLSGKMPDKKMLPKALNLC